MAYQPIDLLDLDAQLTEEERQVRDAVRSFVEREAGPAVRDHFRAGTFPMHLVPPMAAPRLFAAPPAGSGDLKGNRDRSDPSYKRPLTSEGGGRW